MHRRANHQPLIAGSTLVIVGLGIVGTPVWLAPSAAFAAIYDVDRFDDTVAKACSSLRPNDCSLRGAIVKANENAGGDKINAPAGTYVFTLTGSNEDAAATGDLDITDTSGKLTLTGGGPGVTIIDANHIDRVFHVLTGATADISGVTIQNGTATDGDDNSYSSADDGGGVYNFGTLPLANCTLSNNSAKVFGGGILNAGTLTLTNSTLSTNSVFGLNIEGDGGGITNSGSATLKLRT